MHALLFHEKGDKKRRYSIRIVANGQIRHWGPLYDTVTFFMDSLLGPERFISNHEP